MAQAEGLAKECRELELLAGAADADARAAESAEAALGKPTTDEEKKLAGELAEKARKARKEATTANAAAQKKCGEAEEARKKAEEAIKKAEELLKEKTDRGGNVKDDENLDDKLKGLKERLPKKPEQATVIPPSGGRTVETQTANGLHTVIFDIAPGKTKVNLPDDMRAGDTISGTVVAEPKGQTEEERAGNLEALKGYVVEVGDQKVSTPQGSFTLVVPDAPVKFIRIIEADSGKELANTPVPAQAAATTKGANKGFVTAKGGDAMTAQPEPSGDAFRLPTLGQQGRPIEIFGPFDGDASNTTLRFNPIGSATQDLEKRPETVVGGYGPLKPLAESPRKIVFESPTNFTGTAEVSVKEGGVETKGNYRNLGVSLSAPKTNLIRGERTTLTVEVKGLEGIRENVPLQLDSRGVITMDGGNFQNLSIKPQDIQPGGRYTTTRAITGQQAGGFNVTATVIVRRFDMCLRDDRDPRSALFWNTFTGDYVFVSPGPAGQSGTPGGKLQPGGGAAAGGAQTGREGSVQPGGTGSALPTDPVPSPGGFNLTGIGKPAMKGCIITLSHNAPDRRVFARLDVCTKTGSGEVQPSEPKANFSITDANTADNACPGK
ncbi:MAG TPA: hypothetical protein VFZ44_03060 [Pyrinomonadaceae bacterium]